MQIKPRPGVILAGIPATGADVPAPLAREWIAARLAVEVKPDKPKPKAKGTPKAPVIPDTEV